jgi:crotonobetainyl-CoA:carnitine CoA-transferase CaiB-like acyl-CoA transferase
MTGALAGLKLLELSEFVSGPYCGKLMADLGADVVKVEQPRGDVARRLGPFRDDVPDAEGSGLFLYLNTNKRGVTLDLSSASARGPLARLAEWADAVVTNYPPGEASSLGVESEALRALNPRLVVTSITPFGMTGPYRDYAAYPLNTFHAGGEGYCLPGGIGWLLYSDREPLKGAGYLGEYDVGVSAAVATLAAVVGRNGDLDEGETIDVSAQEAQLDMMRYELEGYNDGWFESRATRSLPVGGLVQCRDGFVEIMPLEERMWNGLVELMGNPAWAFEPRYAYTNLMAGFLQTHDILGEIQMEVSDYIGEWALQHTMDEIYDGGQRLGCAIGKVVGPRDLFADRQLEDRDYFVELEHPRAGTLTYAGVGHRFSRTPAAYERPAPLLGEHNEEIYCSLLGYSREHLEALRASGVL